MRFTSTCSILCLLLAGGCAATSASVGGEQTGATVGTPRSVDPHDVLVPAAYRIEVVATGLNFPTGVAFDNDGRAYVTESGYTLSYGPGGAPLPKIIDPVQAFNVLFGSRIVPTDPAAQAAAAHHFAHTSHYNDAYPRASIKRWLIMSTQ